jgi:hypothetical protein
MSAKHTPVHTPVALYGPIHATLMPDGSVHSFYTAPPFSAVLWDAIPLPPEHLRAANDYEPPNTG